MSNRDFLVELGTEELPPKALKSLRDAFAAGIEKGLTDARLAYDRIEAYAAPRRLAVKVIQLVEQQPDAVQEKFGPAVAAAFDAEGKPSKAAEGFARGCGVEVAELERAMDGKNERLVFRAKVHGQPAVALLPGIVEQSLNELPIPKRMRWGATRHEFVRPAHWLVMLFGSDVVPTQLLGIQAGRETRGHRFHCPEGLSLASPADYPAALVDAYVQADFDARRALIKAEVEKLAAGLGGVAVIAPDLLDEVTSLNEWPVPLAGSFEERFLKVPAEALMSSMQGHQKYFPVKQADGSLLNKFITVSNLVSRDPQKVVDGNERVIRPRLTDAAFFFEQDRKHTLASRRERLKTITFQADLGSVWDKSERVAKLAGWIAANIGGDAGQAIRAGELCKCDLVTDMVGEFDELQGIMGEYYARFDGEPGEVPAAMREQYLPKFAGDALPETLTGCAVAIADRLDTLVGIFGIGQLPTGSKDPFALRRASISVLRILVEKGFKLDLRSALTIAREGFSGLKHGEGVVEQVLTYMLERFRAQYEEQGIPVEVFQAVMARNPSEPLDIDARVQAVNAFRQLAEAEALAAANKRVANILAKSEAGAVGAVNAALLAEPQEQALFEALGAKSGEVASLLAKRDYTAFLAALASLRVPVDAFFDKVLVNAEDEALRNNRFALLAQLRALFLEVADISLLAAAK